VRDEVPIAVAAWRIAADVAIYRLRKREAGNLVTSLTLAVALGLSWSDVAARALFGAGLNVFVYLVNDCFDVAIDLRAPGRDNTRTTFLASHLGVAWGVSAALGLALALFGALHSSGLLITALVNAVVIVAYSGLLKHRPVADLVSMGVWGVSMAMTGFPITSAMGWRLASLLGLLSMVTEAVQVLRDEPSDRAAGVRTTAVVWGPRTTSRAAKVLLLGAAAYAAVMIHPVGLALALGVFVPLTPERAAKSWDALRVLFGTTWLALLALYAWRR
jgi:4-hydroxybenzoate polyprenyltransferase